MDTQHKLAIDKILNTVAEQKASDLHLSVGSPPVIRIDDKLIPLEKENIITTEFMNSFIDSILQPDQKKTLLQKKELVISYQPHKQARFRVNIFYQKSVLSAYMRLIGHQITPLAKLGLPLQTVEAFAKFNSGLVLISGAFGSGKTTTAASIIDYINRDQSHYILTIEKPIEYIFQNQKCIIEQREIGRDAVSFRQALSSITQEDVDVIFISDLPSQSVIKQTLNIATSGRLVIATIEADTIIKTLDYIINSFPTNEQQQIKNRLSLDLKGVICQRLIPRIGGGQSAIAEIMISTPAIKSIIKEGSLYQIDNVIQTSRAEGMASFDWALAELVKTNQIRLEDAQKNSSDPQQLSYLLRA